MCGVVALAFVAGFLVFSGLSYYASPRYGWEWHMDDGTLLREWLDGLYRRRHLLAASGIFTVTSVVLALAVC